MFDVVFQLSSALAEEAEKFVKGDIDGNERAGFFQCRVSREDKTLIHAQSFLPMTGDDVSAAMPHHIALTDSARARVIKEAHDRQSSLVEIHAHSFDPAGFSYSDYHGFSSWVPHVMWRLPERPYGAVVIAPNSVHGLVWMNRNEDPLPLGISVLDEGPKEIDAWRTYHE